MSEVTGVLFGDDDSGWAIELDDETNVAVLVSPGTERHPWPHPRSEWTVPERYVVRIDGPSIPYGVELAMRLVDGSIRCERLATTRTRRIGAWMQGPRARVPHFVGHTEERDITGAGMRALRVAELVQWATLAAVTNDSGDQLDLDQLAALFDDPPPDRQARPRVTLDDAHFREVARIYREAKKAGLPPTKRVAEAFYRSHSTAAAWVVEARDRGYLGETTRGRAGEIDKPKKAKGKKR